MFSNYYSNKTKPPQTPGRGTGKARAVAVIGELNVDLVASGLTSAPALGREVLAEDFQTVLGSASAIFACGAARLGHPVSFSVRSETTSTDVSASIASRKQVFPRR